jgi:ABC-2 type transport system ATP-binding protein
MRGVFAGYGGVGVLRGLDLEVRAGEVFVLAGPNGAGKSTAARAACGLIRLRAGTRAIGGVDPRRDRKVRRRVALAPQEPALFPELTVRESIHLAATLGGLKGSARDGAVAEALEAVDGGAAADQRIRTLSGGWRRRASLAVALVGDPMLLVLDEPTEGVDAQTRLRIADAVRASAARGVGILLVSHDGGFIDLVADRIGILTTGVLQRETGRDALLGQTFGEVHLITVRLDRPAEAEMAVTLTEAGLTPSPSAMEWRGLFDEAASRAAALSFAIDGVGGEVAVRRPTLGDLAARISEPAP